MKAMVFAAGKGTRLQPLTNDKPKALVEVEGVPLLERLLTKLRSQDIYEVIINLHHYPDQIRGFLKKHEHFGLDISFSDESNELLETGGGLLKASSFFDDGEPFLVHNVDVISNIDFRDMLRVHQANKALATLAVSSRKSSRYLLLDDRGILHGWTDLSTGEKIIAGDEKELINVAFSGIHIISPEIFNMITQRGKFSIIETYLSLAGTKRIHSFRHDPEDWFDMGKPESIRAFEKQNSSN